MTSQNLSRRSLVTTAAALPALAVPAVAVAVDHPSVAGLDKAAIIARAEEIVEMLRNGYYIRAGWSLDGAKAATFLDSVRRLDLNTSPPDDQIDTILDWASEHGQSLDWVIRGDPGVMICEAAARSPAATSLVDPIFAAIEEHRRTWWDDFGHCSDLDWIARHGETEAVREEAERKLDLLWEQVCAATDKLIDTAPTTNAGVAALLEYAIDHTVKNGTNCWPTNYRNGETWERTLHRSLARALRNIAVEA